MSGHSAACTGKLLWVILFIALCGVVTPMTHGQDEPSQDNEDTREQLVLFANGRMLSGQVTRNAGGFVIEQANGRIQVATEEVKFIAKDLRDAYRKQRDSIVEPTPATHVALANWCISHRLLDEATEELKKCLKSDPENQEARRLLQRLTDIIRAKTPSKTAEPSPAKTTEGFLQPETESLGGLSRDTAAMFTSRIQPLLLNKCGNASCHGNSSTNQFRLSPARTGSNGSRQTTERNLAETLKFVDFDEISSSRLLRATKGSHGGKGTIFVGPPGAEQMRQLREWAAAVADDKRPHRHESEDHKNMMAEKGSKKRAHQVSTASYATSDSVETVEPISSVADDSPKETLKKDNGTNKPQRLKPDPTDAKALATEPDDAFNPEEFNRRFRRH